MSDERKLSECCRCGAPIEKKRGHMLCTVCSALGVMSVLVYLDTLRAKAEKRPMTEGDR